jgi:hypothetical protein
VLTHPFRREHPDRTPKIVCSRCDSAYLENEIESDVHFAPLMDRLNQQTEISLRETSAILEAAFRRVRQLRNVLLEIAERTPTLEGGDARLVNTSDVGPAHSAILLSDSSSTVESSESELVPEMERLRSTLSPEVMARLEHYESAVMTRTQSVNESASHSFGHTTALSRPPNRRRSSVYTPNNILPTTGIYPPISPATTPVLPNRSWLESQRRDVTSNDSATLLGRDVAARERAGPSRSADNHASQLEQILLRQTSEIAQDLDALSQRFHADSRRAATVRLSRPQPLLQTRLFPPNNNEHPHAHGHDPGDNQSLSSNSSNNSSVNSLPFPVRPSAPHRRRWVVRGDTRARSQSLTRPSDVPAAFPATSAMPATSRATREATQHAEGIPTHTGASGLPVLPIDTATTEHGNYRIRRRLSASGEEYTHNIRMSERDEDDYLAWLLPARERMQDSTFPGRTRALHSPSSPSWRAYVNTRVTRPTPATSQSRGERHESSESLTSGTTQEAPGRGRGGRCDSSFQWFKSY